jgi:hypothetical protein
LTESESGKFIDIIEEFSEPDELEGTRTYQK